MSLHNDVMNIPCKYTRSCFPDEAQLLAYKEGHRDARHEAAEMALGQDKIIGRMLNFLQDIADDQYSCLNDLEKTTRRFLAEMSNVK